MSSASDVAELPESPARGDVAAEEAVKGRHRQADEDGVRQPVPARTLVADVCLTLLAIIACVLAYATRPGDVKTSVPAPLVFADDGGGDHTLTVRIDDRNRLSVDRQPLDQYETLVDVLARRTDPVETALVIANEKCLAHAVLDAVQALRRHGATIVRVHTSLY